MPPVTLRRNGKLPSCEPCRKSKLSCDHETPFCGRCQRRKRSDQCVYHPAPMTSSRSSDAYSPISRRRRLSDVTVTNSSSSFGVSRNISRVPEGQNLSTDAYLGSTSYSAVFTEGQDHPKLQDLPYANDAEKQAAHQAKIKLGLTQSNIQEGSEIISLLYDMRIHLASYHRWYNAQCVASLTPFMGDCIELVEQKFEKFTPTRTTLQQSSEEIFISTSKDIVFQSTTTLQDLPSILMGENLRWDIVGLMLITAGFGAISSDEAGPDAEIDQTQALDWKNIARKLLDAGDKCILFCEKLNSLNDVTVWLIALSYILHTQVEGDADPICWRKLGGLTTAIFALGLHQESNGPIRIPVFLVELRRRAFWVAYIFDKTFATFLGRPPMINSGFCSRQIPLDFEDKQLALSTSDLQDLLTNLDENGWNLEGRVDRMCWIRISILCCKFREEILAISLGSSTSGLYERAFDILRRQKEAYDSLPPMLQDRPDQWVPERAASKNFFLLNGNIDRLYNEFLLHRTLVKRLHTEPIALVKVARSMLSQILLICGNRHREGLYANDLPWLIAFYGLPPAGVLALELLHQFSDRENMTDQDFPRSAIIQNLSVLISSINCIVRSANGNYGICSQAKKMLQAILDTVLTPSAPTVQALDQVNTVENLHPQNEINNVGVQGPLPETLMENNQIWFDNTTFDLDFWNSLEDHPLLVWPEAT